MLAEADLIVPDKIAAMLVLTGVMGPYTLAPDTSDTDALNPAAVVTDMGNARSPRMAAVPQVPLLLTSPRPPTNLPVGSKTNPSTPRPSECIAKTHTFPDNWSKIFRGRPSLPKNSTA